MTHLKANINKGLNRDSKINQENTFSNVLVDAMLKQSGIFQNSKTEKPNTMQTKVVKNGKMLQPEGVESGKSNICLESDNLKDILPRQCILELDLTDKTTNKILQCNTQKFIQNFYLTVNETNKDEYLENMEKILKALSNTGAIEIGTESLPLTRGIVSVIKKINDSKLKGAISARGVEALERINMKSEVDTTLDFTRNKKSFIEKLIDAPTNKQEIETFICVKYLSKQIDCAKRGIIFDLTFSNFKKLYKRKYCYYTGVLLEVYGNNRLTLDRIDCNIGYVSGNVVACTRFSNQFKNNMLECGEFFKNGGENLSKSEKVKLLSSMIDEINRSE